MRAIDLLLAKLAGDVRTEVGTHRRPGGARAAGGRRVVRPAGARDRSGVRAAGQPRSAAHPARERVAALPDRRRRLARGGDLRIRPRRVRHDGGQRRSEPAGAARRRSRAGAPWGVRVAARCVLHHLRRRHAGGHRRQVRPGDRGRAAGGEGRARSSSPAPEAQARVAGQRWRRNSRREGITDGVHHGAADDRADGGDEPHPAGRLDHLIPPATRRWRRATSTNCGWRSSSARSRCSPPRSGPPRSGSWHDRTGAAPPWCRRRSCWSTSPIWCGTGRSRRGNRSARAAGRSAAFVRGRRRVSTEPGVHRQPRAGRICGNDLATWWAHPVDGASIAGPHRRHDGRRTRFYSLLAEVDQFDLVRMGAEPDPGAARRSTGDRDSWARSRATTSRTNRSRPACCWRTWRSRRAASTRCSTC